MARPLLSRIAANDIRELSRTHGIVCTPEEIIRLHLAGQEVECPGGGDRLDLIGIPVRCGNAWLFRMSVMGSIWWTDLAWPWFRDSNLMATYALAFCLAHGRGATFDLDGKPCTLRDLRDRRAAADAIKAWAGAITCTLGEVEDAIDRVLPPSDAPRPRCPACGQDLPDTTDRDAAAIRPTDWEGIVHEIAAATGTDPEYWISRTSQDAVIRAWYRARQLMAAKCNQPADTAAPDSLAAAIRHERAVVAAIVQDHRAAAAAAAAAATEIRDPESEFRDLASEVIDTIPRGTGVPPVASPADSGSPTADLDSQPSAISHQPSAIVKAPAP